MTPMVEFRSELTPNCSEAVSFEGNVEVKLAEGNVLTIALPTESVTKELKKLENELWPDQVSVKVYPDSRGEVVSSKTGEVLPKGFSTTEPISLINQLNIITAINKS